MPCHDYGYDEWLKKENELKNTNENIEVDFKAIERLIDQLKFRNDFLSKLLCESCNTLQGIEKFTNGTSLFSDDLKTWWEHHKKCDEKEKENES